MLKCYNCSFNWVFNVLTYVAFFPSRFLKSLSFCSSRMAMAMHSFSQMKTSVQVTHLTQSVGRPWCLASCKTLSPPIGSPSWWDTRTPQQVLVLIVCPWCRASCHQKLSAPLIWEARKAQSGLCLRCRYIKLHRRWVSCVVVTSCVT